MLLGFKRQFAQYVEEGSKTHTIRAPRKGRQIRIGDHLECYVDPRQKTTRLLGRFLCVDVETITIHPIHESEPCPLYVRIADSTLDADETEQLFYRDGFRGNGPGPYPHTRAAKEFWSGRIPFYGFLIHWENPRSANAAEPQPALDSSEEHQNTNLQS